MAAHRCCRHDADSSRRLRREIVRRETSAVVGVASRGLRRSPNAARAQRRGQVDAAEDRRRLHCARQRQRPIRRQAVSVGPAVAPGARWAVLPAGSRSAVDGVHHSPPAGDDPRPVRRRRSDRPPQRGWESRRTSIGGRVLSRAASFAAPSSRRCSCVARVVCSPTNPYRGVAPKDAEALTGAFVELAASGVAVVITGHEVATLLDAAHHVTWCTSGTTYELGPPAARR